MNRGPALDMLNALVDRRGLQLLHARRRHPLREDLAEHAVPRHRRSHAVLARRRAHRHPLLEPRPQRLHLQRSSRALRLTRCSRAADVRLRRECTRPTHMSTCTRRHHENSAHRGAPRHEEGPRRDRLGALLGSDVRSARSVVRTGREVVRREAVEIDVAQVGVAVRAVGGEDAVGVALALGLLGRLDRDVAVLRRVRFRRG